MRVALFPLVFLVLLLDSCKHTNIGTASSSSSASTDYVEAFFCCDYDEQEVTVENYEALLESIGAALDTLSSPSRCIAPVAEMNAVLLKLDSITKPEGFMDRKRAYNEYFSAVLDSLESANADDPWNYNIAENLVHERLQHVIQNTSHKH